MVEVLVNENTFTVRNSLKKIYYCILFSRRLQKKIVESNTGVSLCSSRKYPCAPQGRLTEIPRGRGVSESQFLERKYDTKMEFLEGRGVQFKKKNHGRGMDIFWNNIHLRALA